MRATSGGHMVCSGLRVAGEGRRRNPTGTTSTLDLRLEMEEDEG